MTSGVISGIKRGEIHDGDGLRTTVFFKGCPLSCLWCHNPESIAFTPEVGSFREKCVGCRTCTALCPSGAIRDGIIDRARCVSCFTCAGACPTEALVGFGERISAEDLFARVQPDFPFFSGGRGGVTLSGGECLAQPDFAVEMAARFHAAGLSVDIDTCGFVSYATFERILPFTDTFLYDVKAFDADLHRRLTGQDNARILDNLRRLSESGAKIEIRYPFVVGYNDGECEKIGEFLAGLPGIRKVKVLPYHRYAASRYRALGKPDDLPPASAIPDQAALDRAVAVLSGYGLRAVNGAKDD